MKTDNIPSFLPLLLLAGVILALFTFLVIRPIYGADIYFVFYPSARHLWDGTATLYGANSNGFLYPAHAMFYWMLLSLAPLAVANALHIFITFGLLFATVHLWKDYVGWSMFKTTLAIAGIYTMDHLIRGQMDVLTTFGMLLSFVAAKRKAPYLLGLGATIAMIKPTNLLLPLFLIAWSLRGWSLIDIMKAAIIPLLTIMVTFLVFGVDWMLHLLDLLSVGAPYDPLSTLSIWQLSDAANLPVFISPLISLVLLIAVIKYRDLSAENFAFAIVANLLMSNYVAGYHYVALIPAILCIRNRWLVLICWLLSLFPLMRLISYDYAWLIILLPVFIAFVLLYQIMTHRADAEIVDTVTAD